MAWLRLHILQILLLGGVALPCAVVAGEDPRDPWEGFNRKVFAFNDGADRYVLRPVAKGYKTVTPSVVDQGVGNFFSNLGELRNFANDILQAKPGDAGVSVSRFIINTTVGVLGFFDVASHIGLDRTPEDFGQTLAVWGVGDGPFLMLPFLGPSTLRDGVGRTVDTLGAATQAIDPESARYGLFLLEQVQIRASLLGSDELVSGDRYTFFKDAYLQRRQFLINDGVFQDSFGGDEFESFDDF